MRFIHRTENTHVGSVDKLKRIGQEDFNSHTMQRYSRVTY